MVLFFGAQSASQRRNSKMKIYKATLILLFLNIHWPVSASEALITERIRSMELAEKAMELIQKSIAVADYKTAEKNAEKVKNFADHILTYFPIGSGASASNSSEASNDIWEDFSAFKSNVEDLRYFAKQMVLGAKTNKRTVILKAFIETSNTCDNCHNHFRN